MNFETLPGDEKRSEKDFQQGTSSAKPKLRSDSRESVDETELFFGTDLFLFTVFAFMASHICFYFLSVINGLDPNIAMSVLYYSFIGIVIGFGTRWIWMILKKLRVVSPENETWKNLVELISLCTFILPIGVIFFGLWLGYGVSFGWVLFYTVLVLPLSFFCGSVVVALLWSLAKEFGLIGGLLFCTFLALPDQFIYSLMVIALLWSLAKRSGLIKMNSRK